jgi:hypothetical protein
MLACVHRNCLNAFPLLHVIHKSITELPYNSCRVWFAFMQTAQPDDVMTAVHLLLVLSCLLAALNGPLSNDRYDTFSIFGVNGPSRQPSDNI